MYFINRMSRKAYKYFLFCHSAKGTRLCLLNQKNAGNLCNSKAEMLCGSLRQLEAMETERTKTDEVNA